MDTQGIWWVLGLLAALSLAGVHVAIAFAIASAVGLYFTLGDAVSMANLLQQTALTGLKDYNLLVIPMFTVMGLLIAHSGAAGDLFNVINRRLRKVPGRLAVATVGGNAIFAAVTGVGVAAAAAFSHISYPIMRKAGYSRSFATGCIAGSSVLGLLIPPSVFMIVWAILTEQSVGKLFAAGLIPGLLLASLYAIYCVTRAVLEPGMAPQPSEAQLQENRPQGKALRDERIGCAGVSALIAMTLGGIWKGWITPTEGAAVGMLGAMVVARARGMGWRAQWECFSEAGRTVTPIMFLLLCAAMYAKLLALEGVPDQVRSLLEGMGLGREATFVFMVITWFLLGCLIDSISIMLLTVPIFWPIAAALGYDPIVFALVGILVIEAGVLTPPFGICVFVVKAAIPDPTIEARDIFIGATPYWILILVVAALIYAWPPLATWLPSRI